MKVKHWSALLLAILTFYSCDDSTKSIGMDILSQKDRLTSQTTTFDVTTKSVIVDKVFAKTDVGYVGNLNIPEYGSLETGFMTELNCDSHFELPEVYKYDEATKKATGMRAGDSLVAARLVVFYKSWFGDSLSPQRMTAYELTKRMPKGRYTDINPEKYYNSRKPLARKAYTAYDLSVDDKYREEKDANGNSTFYPHVIFELDRDKFQELILEGYKKHPENFKDADKFLDKVFKGVYLKNDMGQGTILYIDRVDIQFTFRFHYLDKETGVALKQKDGQDSLYYSTNTLFASTKEVMQTNCIRMNKEQEKQLVEDNPHNTFIKSPAGIFTEAVLPVREIENKIKGDTLNAVRMVLNGFYNPKKMKGVEVPSSVLMIRKAEAEKFFEENKLPDDRSSFIAVAAKENGYTYSFNNLARLYEACIQEKSDAQKKAGSRWNEEEWLEKNPDWNKVLIIPVELNYDKSNPKRPTLVGVSNLLKPSFVKLTGGDKPLKLEVVHTSFR